MGCNCGKKATAAATYVYVNAAGQSSQPTTQVQALAMKARAGNAGTVKPA